MTLTPGGRNPVVFIGGWEAKKKPPVPVNHWPTIRDQYMTVQEVMDAIKTIDPMPSDLTNIRKVYRGGSGGASPAIYVSAQ